MTRRVALSRSPRIRGAERDRTDDLRLAKPALSQLSYSPVGGGGRVACGALVLAFGASALGSGPNACDNDVGQGRVELPTSRLSGVRSNHLSYWPRLVADATCWLCYRDAALCWRKRLQRASLPGN